MLKGAMEIAALSQCRVADVWGSGERGPFKFDGNEPVLENSRSHSAYHSVWGMGSPDGTLMDLERLKAAPFKTEARATLRAPQYSTLIGRKVFRWLSWRSMSRQDISKSHNVQYPQWQREFEAAVLERDPEKLRQRVDAAEAAIFLRSQALAGSEEGSAERQAISEAIATLRTIQREKLGYPDWHKE
jgi:hypothetical protein